MEIRVEDLEYTYRAGTVLERRALRGVTFSLPAGKVLGILGGTGSGKTTLIKNLNGLLLPTAGRVLADGWDTREWGGELRKRIGVAFQRPERQLFEESVYADVSFVLRRFTYLSPAAIREKVSQACRLVGLDLERVGDRRPESLSGGEKRKAALAGVLANDPEVLVLDEPAVGLDPLSTATLVGMIRGFMKSNNHSAILVSHDMEPFLAIVDELLVLEEGKSRALGRCAEVCRQSMEDPKLRRLLPAIALAAHHLRSNGYPIPENEYDAATLADAFVTALGIAESGPVRRRGVASADKQ